MKEVKEVKEKKQKGQAKPKEKGQRPGQIGLLAGHTCTPMHILRLSAMDHLPL